ncbi:MAG: Zn-dependent hydrolase [Rhodospirillales bacterium]|nr:Zn-dependent hydrolase [Rhodospirillales bacterium]
MSVTDARALRAAVEARLPLAAALFDEIREASADSAGVTRPAWSEKDQFAARRIAEAAGALGLETAYDHAGNLYCTLPGRDRAAPAVLTGSHTDSVPTGGHYDGLAGAVAGLVVLAAFRDVGWQPGRDVTAIATRAEESVWFGIPFIGARLALGSLSHDHLDTLRRSDTGRTLADHMAALGLDADALRRETAPRLSPANARAFLELHIEQGPVLVAEGVQVAIPTTIRGNLRWPGATCVGRYDHSGATPRAHRQDTVLAVAELVQALEAFWIAQEESGVPDTVFTVGKCFTDGAHHAMTKVPGRCDFTLNFGGTTQAFLDACRAEVEARAAEIATRRRVAFELGEYVQAAPAPLDADLRAVLDESAATLDIPTRSFATVGHDAAVFQRAGIPAAMVLVRNAHGSHNPDEAMTLEDFGAGVAVLAAAIARLAA